MKTKLRKFSRRTVSMVLAVLMMVSVLGIGSLITTSAADVNKNATGDNCTGGQLLVKKPSGWSKVSIMFGGSWGYNNNWLHCYSLTNISGTDFYYISLKSQFTDGSLGGWYFFDGTRSSENDGTSKWYETEVASFSNHTTKQTYGFNSGSNYVSVISGTGSSCTVTTGAAAGGSDYSKTIADNSTYKKNQTVKVALKAVGASGYTEKTSSNTSTGGTVKLSGKQWNAWNTTKAASSTANNYSSALSNAVVTSNVTLTTTTYSGYTFDGWYSSATGSGTQYTVGTGYTVSAATTTYARYSENANTVTFKKKLGSAAATTITTKNAGVTTKASYTAPAQSGYNFTGWTITSGSSNATNVTGTESASDTTVSLNASGAVTVTAHYEEAGTCAITAKKTNSSGAVLSGNTESMTIGSSMTVYAEGNAYHTSGNFSVSSNATAVASVSSATVAKNGTFTVNAKSVGTATITISCPADSKSTTFTVNVSKSDLAASFSSADGKYVLNGDNTQTATATATPTISSKTWTSSNTSVATVTNAGAVTPKAAGSTTLTVTATFANGGTDTATVSITVQDPTLTVSSNTLALDYTSDTTNAGSDYKGTNTFTVTTNGNNPAYNPVTEITVESSDTSVVTVSPATITSTSAQTVTATAKKVGTANIIVRYKINGTEVTSLRKTIPVTVSAYDVNMTLYVQASNNQSSDKWTTAYFIPHSSTSTSSQVSGGTQMTKIGTVSNTKPVFALNITKKQYTDGFVIGQTAATRTSGKRNTVRIASSDPSNNLVTITDNGTYWYGGSTAQTAVTITKPVITAKGDEVLNAGTLKTAGTPAVTGSVSSYLWTSGTTSVATISGTTNAPTITAVSAGNSASTVRAFIPLTNTGITFTSLETSSSAAYDYIASNAQSFTITVADVKHTVTVQPVSRDTSSGTYANNNAAASATSVSPTGGVSHGATATVSATAASGYVLTGYYSAASGSATQYTNGAVNSVTSDMTVYARFEQKYELTFTSANGSVSGTGYSSNKLTTYAGEKPSDLTVAVVEGYRIDWANSTNLAKYYNAPSTLVGSVTLTAKEVANINSADKVDTAVTIAYEAITPRVNFTSYKTDNGSTYTAGGGALSAAYSTGGGGGAATPSYYLLYSENDNTPSSLTNNIPVYADTSGTKYTAKITIPKASTNYYLAFSSSTSYTNILTKNVGTVSVTKNHTGVTEAVNQHNSSSNDNYYMMRTQVNAANTVVYVSFDPASPRNYYVNSSYADYNDGTGGGASSGGVVNNATVPYDSTVTFTADDTYTSGGDTYKFIGWYSTAQPAANETALSTSLTYTKNNVTDDVSVYARYKKVLYLTFYNSYVKVGDDFVFTAAPPRTVEVGMGSSVRARYTYKAGDAEQRGEEHTVNATGDYYEGNRLLIIVGETVTLKYSTLASSDAIKGIYFNNDRRYTTETETDNLYYMRATKSGGGAWTAADATAANGGVADVPDDDWEYDYATNTTIYADENYYDGAAKTAIHNNSSGYVGHNGMNQSTHTISWVATQSYLNIDIELGTKYQLHINDDKYEGINVANMNDEGYYFGGETIEYETPNHTNGLKITLDNTTDTSGTYSFSSTTPVWKNKAGDTVAAPTGVTVTPYTSGNAVADQASNIDHWLVYGTMPHSDLYLSIPVVKKYNMKLSNIVVSDNGSSKRTMLTECGSNSTSATDCIGTISGKVNGTAQATLTDDGTYYTYPSNNNAGHVEAYTSSTNNKYLNGGVNRNGYNVEAGDTVTYSFAWNSGKDAEYTFVGWFEGTYNNSSNTDFSYDVNYNKKLSGKESFTFTPTKNTVVIAVATRDVYIGGNFTKDGGYTSTASSQTWSKNRPLMDFDPTYVNPSDPSKKGRYTYTFDTVTANTEYQFRCYDTVGTGASGQDKTNLSVWSQWSGEDYANDPDDVFYGRHKYGAEFGYSHGAFVYKNNTNNWSLIDNTASDHDSNKNHQANGYAAPVTVYFYAYDGGMSVSSTYQWSRAYVSEGRGVDVKSVSGGKTTYNSPTASVANKTVNNKDVTVTTNTNSYGHDGMFEKIYECLVKEKDGSIVVTASPKDENLELQAFLVYNIETKASEAVKTFTSSGSGDAKSYTGNIPIPNNSKIYVCPIYKFTDAYITSANLECHNVFVRADDIDKDDWGGLVAMYSWGTTSGYDSGGWPGQLMVPSDDGTSFYAPLVFQKGGLAGVTFNNYTQVYGGYFINFLGKYQDAGVSDVAYSNYTKPTADHNYIYQVFDYREPISIIENLNEKNPSIYDSEDMTLTFELKPGNKTTETIGNGAYNASFNYEYLTDSSGKYRVDLNGNKISTNPTASYYVVCNYTEAYAPGGAKSYDFVDGSRDGTSTHNRYSIDWNVYDQNHVLVSGGTKLSASFTDVHKSEMLTHIAKQLIDDGQPVSGKAVMIAYENPKVSSSDNTEAVRYSGQWYADGLNTIINGNVRVGIYADGAWLPSDTNSPGYATGTVSFTPNASSGEKLVEESGCTGNSLAEITKIHASNGDLQFSVNTTDNFLGWYRKTKDGDFEPIGSNYKSQAINPSFNEDITYYAFYSAQASYRFGYTARDGSTKYYTVKGSDLTEAEMDAGGTLNATTRASDITSRLGGINQIRVFNRTFTYPLTGADTSKPYVITFNDPGTVNTYSVSVYGADKTLIGTTTSTPFGSEAIDLYKSTIGGKAANTDAIPRSLDNGNVFIGWKKYDGSEAVGDYLSTMPHFGYAVTEDMNIIACYGTPAEKATAQADAWHSYIDKNVITQELTSETTGTIYNDSIIAFRNSAGTNYSLPLDGRECGIVVVSQTAGANATQKTNFDNITKVNLQSYANYFRANDLTVGKMNNTNYGEAYAFNITATELSDLNRVDLCQVLDFEKFQGGKYKVISYYYDGSDCICSDITPGTYTVPDLS